MKYDLSEEFQKSKAQLHKSFIYTNECFKVEVSLFYEMFKIQFNALK
jgi:hypothetical protein